ncbi:MAG: pyridoxal-phosphate dependent enzyme, partial [Bacteroidia bacterium]|nr:pyridoxal-phosphate dependent enzyme [Bacteroidia bacterium]
YYSVAKRLSTEIPGAWYPNQYDNLSNMQAHYEQTGPEIWKQTEGKITHLVVGAGTGGTITGVAKFLKEKNPAIKIWGIDTYGSVLKKFHETGMLDKNEIYPYITEGIGEDFIPKNYDFTVIDHFEKVTDKDAALMTREIVRKEAIWVGYSAGSAIAGLMQMKDRLTEKDLVVVIFHDHGTRYLNKIFNDDWMREKGFIDRKGMTARDIVASRKNVELIAIDKNDSIDNAIKLMTENNFSQLPVTSDGRVVGSVNENELFNKLLQNPDIKKERVETIMQEAFPFVDITTPVESLSKMLSAEKPAVLIKDFKAGGNYIITRFDVVEAMVK